MIFQFHGYIISDLCFIEIFCIYFRLNQVEISLLKKNKLIYN